MGPNRRKTKALLKQHRADLAGKNNTPDSNPKPKGWAKAQERQQFLERECALRRMVESRLPESVKKPEEYRHGAHYPISPRDTDEITVSGYDPARDVACAICKVPYGALAVPRDDLVRTHEILASDRSVFLDPLHRFADRQTYSGYTREREEKRQRRIEREREEAAAIFVAVQEAEFAGAFEGPIA